jgi:predicted amidohydrolase
LQVDALGRPWAVAVIYQEVSGIVGGKAYCLEVAGELHDVPSPLQSTIVRLTWLKTGKPVHPAGVLADGPNLAAGGQFSFRDTWVAPAEADAARVALSVRWLQGGALVWHQATLRPASALPTRKVKIGTVYLVPHQSTPEKNLDLFCQQLDAAGKLQLDVVCLGEAITQVGTGRDAAQCAQPIPGPNTKRLGEAAARNHLWVVAGLAERDGAAVYNTAVLLDRSGGLAGKYRKVHLPREEWMQGIQPGSEYPVFKTEFGTVAIQICYDWFFPEAAAIFARRGAEILFAPTWGNTLADHDGIAEGETIFRARARDNGLYLVPSVYSGNSMVIDPLGRIRVSSSGKQGLVWSEVDLADREPFRQVGRWRAIGPRDRMPATYGPLTEK